MWAKQSTAATLIVGPILDSAGAEYTGAVIGDLSLSKNGGTLTALAAAATLTHIANGQYTLVTTTGNTDTLGRAQITCNKSTYQMPPVNLMVVPAMVFDAMVLGTDVLQADVIQLVSDTQSVTDLKDFADAGYDPSTNKVQGVVLTDTVTTYTGNTPQTGDSYSIVSSVTHGNSALKTLIDTLTTYVDTEVASIKAKTDNLPSDPADASDIASSFSTINSTLSTIAAYIDTEVAAIKAKTDNLPADPADASDIAASFSSISSTLTTIASYIDTEVAAIKAKTDNLPTDPADQSAVEAAITSAVSGLASQSSVNTIDTVVDNIFTSVEIIKNSTVAVVGAITTSATSTSIPTNITGYATGFFDDALLQLSSGALDYQARPILSYNTDGTFTMDEPFTSAPANGVAVRVLVGHTHPISQIADGVWEEQIADHSGTSGSTAEALAAAGGAGDPWITTLPGSYTGSQAGKILSDILVDTAEIGAAGAGLTTLATQASVNTIDDFLDTEIAAIKAKTDNLPTDPADQSAVESAITSATSVLATAANLATVAGYLDTEIAAILADTNELQVDWANGGRLDLILGARASQTSVDDIPTNAELTTALASADDAVLAAISTLQTSVNTIDDYVDTEVAAIKAKTDLLVTFPINFSSLGINASGHISRVTLVDTTTANTDLVSAASIATAVLTTQLVEGYAADGIAPTLTQAIFLMQQAFTEFVISGTNILVKKLDSSTTAATYAMDSAVSPTQRLRTS